MAYQTDAVYLKGENIKIVIILIYLLRYLWFSHKIINN